MTRAIVYLLALVLIVSLAAPAGAVFASTAPDAATETVAVDQSVATQELSSAATTVEGDELIVEPMVTNDTAPSQPQSFSFSAPLSSESEEPEPPTSHQYTKIVVSHVVTGFADVANREIIELYNNSDEELDLTGWCVLYKSSSLTERSLCLQPRDPIAQYVMLPARSYAVLASNGLAAAYPDFAHDGRLQNDGLAEVRGSVVLRDASGAYVDGVAWGALSPASARIDPVEGATLAAQPTRGQALERRVVDGREYQDVDDNANDFILSEPRVLYQAGALRDVTDVCLNISGIQEQVPESYYRDQATNNCSDIPPPPPPEVNMCKGMALSEIGANLDEQFIEVYNYSDEAIVIGDCQLQTNRDKKTFVFAEDVTLEPSEFLVVLLEDTELTLTKTTTGTVYILSSDGTVEVDSVEYRNLAKDTSWALTAGVWQQTYSSTPGSHNIYEKFLPCEEGYWRNEETGRCNKTVELAMVADCGEGRERNPLTGRCRNIPSESLLRPCSEGQYRSEETNRCRSIATAAASVLKPCADDQFRNPTTNRCKKIASSEDSLLTDCGEGRERNPATNRCRNVLASAPPPADFAVEPIEAPASVFIGWWVLGGIMLLALGYAGWEWREEIGRAIRKAGTVFVSKK